MKHLRIEDETHIRDKHGKVGLIVHHVSSGGSGHKAKSRGQNKRNLGPQKQSFKKAVNQNPNSKPNRIGPWQIGYYVRECKDCKSGQVAHVFKKVNDMVANIGATVNVCEQRESFHTYRPTPPATTVVCADGQRVEFQGRYAVLLKFIRGEWVTLRDLLCVPTISKGAVSADKFDKGGFKMELEKG
uniref:Retrovirus-related Pol polyprotein from transposon TNT 1-94-like beta-barrel domain-containing protein n=1 Tax=Lactuca sativa TaxID=4236 RepID=A0A9R1UMS8_LACSA|nr:hypothetical protein LSAT_V11C800430850 [Lactuca sativa]